MASLVERDKATLAAAASLVDFSSLPTTALDAYVVYHDLAPGYPPRSSPPPHSPRVADTNSSLGGADVDQGKTKAGEGGVDDDDEDEEEEDANDGDNDEAEATNPSSTRKKPSKSKSRRSATLAAQRAGQPANAHPGDDDQARAAEPPPLHFFDHSAADTYLGGVAGRHFAQQAAPKEGEVVVGFLYRCRIKDSCLKIAQP